MLKNWIVLQIFILKIAITSAGFVLDNEILGSPKIECNPDSISFSFNTRTTFKGNVYIRGFFYKSTCRKRYDSSFADGATLTIRLGDCGMTRMRQLVPRGVSLHATFVANFHPLFATKEDRAFDVRCFYAHTDSVLKAEIDVNGVPAETLEQATTVVPKCEYSLREGSLDGPRVKTAMIGVPIFHRWDCDTNGNYGILIRSCSIVDNRLSESVPFLDDNGCSISRDFPQVVYSTSLNSAHAVIEALSFPDQQSISFACQIQLCDKMADECRGVSPPHCNNLPPQQFVPSAQIPIDNRIIDGIPLEPWMKEPLPVEDDNETTILEIPSPMPRLSDDQWVIESNHMERTGESRGKRLAEKNVMDVFSNELFIRAEPVIDPTSQAQHTDPTPFNNDTCVPVETLYISAGALLVIVVLSVAILIYIRGQFTKKKQELVSSTPLESKFYASKF